MKPNNGLARVGAAFGVVGLLAGACGASSESATESGTVDESGVELAGNLADCPNPLVIQTDWFPEPEHGALYNLTAGQGSVDAESGRFSGPLAADPSITLEVRAGGPYIGGQTTVSLMATDEDIFLGYVNTDEAIKFYDKVPTLAVVAPLDVNPQMVMFDPETYPISDWSEVKATEAVIQVFVADTFTEFLVGKGLIDEAQLDASYDGSPTRFVGAGGAVMQQGFVTQEPYNYEHIFEQWGKPVESLLIHDAGFEIYQGAIAIRENRHDEKAASCLSAFVPVFQQSIVDFQDDPTATNAAIRQAVTDLDSFWTLSEGGVANSVALMDSLNIVSNGPNDTIGDFDMDRVNAMIKLIGEETEIPVPEGLTAEDLVTNEYIDTSIGR